MKYQGVLSSQLAKVELSVATCCSFKGIENPAAFGLLHLSPPSTIACATPVQVADPALSVTRSVSAACEFLKTICV